MESLRQEALAEGTCCHNTEVGVDESGYRPIYGMLNEEHSALIQYICRIHGIPFGDQPNSPYIGNTDLKEMNFTERQVNLLQEIAKLYEEQRAYDVNQNQGVWQDDIELEPLGGNYGYLEALEDYDGYVGQEESDGRMVNSCQVLNQEDLDVTTGFPYRDIPYSPPELGNRQVNPESGEPTTREEKEGGIPMFAVPGQQIKRDTCRR